MSHTNSPQPNGNTAFLLISGGDERRTETAANFSAAKGALEAIAELCSLSEKDRGTNLTERSMKWAAKASGSRRRQRTPPGQLCRPIPAASFRVPRAGLLIRLVRAFLRRSRNAARLASEHLAITGDYPQTARAIAVQGFDAWPFSPAVKSRQ
jgi:hypothetical protein